MNSIEVLEAALNRMRTVGWCQGSANSARGRSPDFDHRGDCPRNTIAIVAGSGDWQAGQEAVDSVRRLVPDLYEWNDHPHRRFAEVEQLMLTAIRNEKARLAIPLEVPAEQVPA